MRALEFYTALDQLGEFRCQRDLRRFNNKAKKDKRMDQTLYLNHFGFCRNGQYHHCDFELSTGVVTEFRVVAYQKAAEREGQPVRLRSGSFDYWGRGRRYTPNKKNHK